MKTLKRTFLLLVAVAAFSLPGCGLFCEDESSYNPERFEDEAQPNEQAADQN